MKKVLYLFGLIVATLVLSSCNNNKTKWIGQVSPGSYYGIYDFHMGWNTAHVTLQLTCVRHGKEADVQKVQEPMRDILYYKKKCIMGKRRDGTHLVGTIRE